MITSFACIPVVPGGSDKSFPFSLLFYQWTQWSLPRNSIAVRMLGGKTLWGTAVASCHSNSLPFLCMLCKKGPFKFKEFKISLFFYKSHGRRCKYRGGDFFLFCYCFSAFFSDWNTQKAVWPILREDFACKNWDTDQCCKYYFRNWHVRSTHWMEGEIHSSRWVDLYPLLKSRLFPEFNSGKAWIALK